MYKDQLIGLVILLVSILAIVGLGYAIFTYGVIVLQILVFLGVLVIFGIFAWIGYAMLVTPPPKPISELETLEEEKKETGEEKKEG